MLSVPTTYRDPKGLFVLESLAAGVPAAQPRHGAFPEMLERLGGGRPGSLERSAATGRRLGVQCDDTTRRFPPSRGTHSARRIQRERHGCQDVEVLQRF